MKPYLPKITCKDSFLRKFNILWYFCVYACKACFCGVILLYMYIYEQGACAIMHRHLEALDYFSIFYFIVYLYNNETILLFLRVLCN